MPMQYLSTWCAIDVFSSVPFDWFFPQLFAGLGGLTRMSKLLKVARVLKVFKLLQLTSKDNAFTEIFEEMLYTSDMADYLTLLKLTLATTFVGHIMGCLWAAVARGSRTSWQFGYFDGERVYILHLLVKLEPSQCKHEVSMHRDCCR